MKKFTAVLLALILIFGSAFPAFGTEIGYDDPTEDIPFFGEMIFPSEAEMFSELMQLLENTTLTDLFNDVMANFDTMISGSTLIGYFYFFTFFFPLWVVAQF